MDTLKCDDSTTEVLVTYFMFDQYWMGANLSRIDRLMSHEIEALIDYHWRLLLKEVKKEE